MPDSQRGRTERLISMGRVALAALAFLATWVDPFDTSPDAGLTLALLGAYLVYAVLVMVLVSRIAYRMDLLQVVTHALDLVAFSMFMVLTEGPNSPFYVYFVFALVAGALRWHLRGALWTTGVVLVLFLGLGVFNAYVSRDPAFEPSHVVIQCLSLAVVGALLALLGFHLGRLGDEMGRLTDWSRQPMPATDAQSFYSNLLGQAAGVMGARRALLTWEDEEEPWLRFAYWHDGQAALFSTAPGELDPAVATDLEGGFLCPDVRGGDGVLAVYHGDRTFHRRRGAPINREFAEHFDMRDVVAVPIAIEGGDGRLFFLDNARITTDELTSAGLVGRVVGILIEEVRLRACLQESAAFAERVRLAGDLHDGVLQSLAGTALQLETARRLLETREPAAREVIESAQRSLVQEQRELRVFVDALRPGSHPHTDPAPDLRARLEELQESVAGQWGLQVDVALEGKLGSYAAMSDELSRDVSFMVHEGLVNSARHASASRAWAIVRVRSEDLEILVGDDGKGFPFRGRYDASSLLAQGAGPEGLVRRVDTLGGRLTVDSSPEGSLIEIALPLRPERSSTREIA